MMIVRRASWLISLLLVGGFTSAQPAQPTPITPVAALEPVDTYPSARKTNTTDRFHGTEVHDPYRWMEDLRGQELAAWIEAQNKLSSRRLEALPAFATARANLDRVKDVYPTREPGREVGGRTFFRAFENGQIQLMVQEPGGLAPRALVDAVALGEGRAVKAFEPSPDGRLVAYVVGEEGADWGEIRIRDVGVNRDLPVVLPNVRFEGPMAWSADGSGLLYRRFAPPREGKREAPAEDPAIYLHRLGTSPEQDVRLYGPPGELRDWGLAFGLAGERRQLFVYLERGPWHDGNLGGSRVQVQVVELEMDGQVRSGTVPLTLTAPDAAYRVLHVEAGRALVFTDKDAPRRRVVSVDLGNPAPTGWRDIVAEGDSVITHAQWLGGRLVVHALENVRSEVKVFDAAGKRLTDVPLPGTGVVQVIIGSPDSHRVWMLYSGLLQAPVLLEHDLDAGTTKAVSAGPGAPDMSDFEARQEWFTSRDGTRVPMFVVARRGLPRDGSTPTILYGYGASSTAELPTFREDVIAWLQMGGAYAIANVRGGGEFGKAWYEAATRERKQTSFDDFIAAAGHLVATGLTTPRRLAITGASNGGLLVTATMLQRPDVIAAVMADVPVTDVLRLRHSGNGPRQLEQWGTPEDPKVFPALRAYSPVHNVVSNRCYPATLITTVHDDERLPAWHAYKFTAALQAAQGCDAPILLLSSDSGGHSGGNPEGWMDAAARQLAFAAHHLGLVVEH